MILPTLKAPHVKMGQKALCS